MPRKRLVVEMGMGVDIRGGDYTKAAVRALKDALWHNSLTVVPALGYTVDQMEVCLLYTSPSPRDRTRSRMPSSA